MSWLIWVLLLALPVLAVQPVSWQQRTFEDFAAGKGAGVELRAEGAVQLAPSLEELAKLEAERIWSLASGPDGTLYAGTGDLGRIYALPPKGDPVLLFDSPELAIHSLAVGADGALYAGTAPDGIIYRIDPKGQVSTLAQTGSAYVWDLEFDARGRLCAATGQPARVLSISTAGEVDTLCALADQHVMSLLFHREHLYAATARAGRIYEIADTTARLLCETGYEEVHRLAALEDGTLYATALSQASGDQKEKSALFRIGTEGAALALWQAEETQLLDLLADKDGTLLATAAKPAQLCRFAREGRLSLVARFEDFAPSCLARFPSGALCLGASQSGVLHRLGSSFAREGRFESAAEDFGVQARWGGLRWRAELPADTRLAFQTRSGNSQEPDPTWSAWSAELEHSGSPLSSPPARFLQYRALLRSTAASRTPVLLGVDIAALPANLRPEIKTLEIQTYQPPGQDQGQDQGQGGPPLRGRRLPQRKSLRLLRWQAQDANGDKLSYTLYLKGSGQQEWKKAEEGLEQNSFIWDTETMPEGLTQLRLVATDYPDNPPGLALEAERLSPPFLIDNSPPDLSVEVEQRDPLRLALRCTDRISPLQRAQYTVDYGDQAQQLTPEDGLFDSQEERVRFAVEGLAPGEHVIAVQVWDRLDNVGAVQLVIKINP
ncbi:MAG: hypothetical protein HYW07_16325 [Candidatus Latescibacteria bacterium]|nr:hypothetical protein [Candidatus Latescibacterota bacterium]